MNEQRLAQKTDIWLKAWENLSCKALRDNRVHHARSNKQQERVQILPPIPPSQRPTPEEYPVLPLNTLLIIPLPLKYKVHKSSEEHGQQPSPRKAERTSPFFSLHPSYTRPIRWANPAVDVLVSTRRPVPFPGREPNSPNQEKVAEHQPQSLKSKNDPSQKTPVLHDPILLNSRPQLLNRLH